MFYIILPIANTINEFEGFGSLFSFYRNGIKGIVEDIVLSSNGISHYRYFAPNKEKDKIVIYEDFVESVVAKYLSSQEACFTHHSETDSKVLYIELITEMLYVAIVELLDMMLRNKTTYIDSSHEWVGNDFLIRIRG